MKMEQIECSKTSAYKIQTPGNHPEENIQHGNPYRKPNLNVYIWERKKYGHMRRLV
jgi:hypothetical protein